MNQVILIGRLTKAPTVSYSQAQELLCIARYTLAVDRRFARDGEQNADFINCVVFGKGAEFAQKYLDKGTKIAITGRIQTGSYTNNAGQKVFTTDVVVESQEFVEKKQDAAGQKQETANTNAPRKEDAFMSIPDGVEDELPFV